MNDRNKSLQVDNEKGVASFMNNKYRREMLFIAFRCEQKSELPVAKLLFKQTVRTKKAAAAKIKLRNTPFSRKEIENEAQ